MTFLAIIVAATITVQAQKVKVKDGKVLIDKVPVALIEGEAGMFKGIDLTYKSLDGNLLFTLKLEAQEFFMPGSAKPSWYQINFFKPAKAVRYSLDENGVYYSEKKISELMFGTITPPLLKNNEIDPAALEEFVSKYDATEKIKKDSAKQVTFENEMMEKLKLSQIDRNTDAPVVCKRESSDGVTTKYEISQEKKIIGWIEQKVTEAMGTKKTEFWVYRKFATPQVIDGDSLPACFAAYYLQDSFPKIWTMQDKQATKVQLKSLQELAEYMVKKGFM